MAVNPAAISSAQTTRTERRASRQQRRSERQAARETRRAAAASTDAATVKISTDAPKVEATKTEVAKTDTTKTETPKSEAKNFIGSTKGANVVNFAVQGAAGGNKIAVFGSGSGPKAVKTDQDKSTETAEKVDTVA